MEYRLLKNAELSLLAALRWDFKAEEEPILDPLQRSSFIAECAAFLRRPSCQNQYIHFGAFDSPALIAMASIYRAEKVPSPLQMEGAIGYLTNVYTSPSYRNQGVGYHLLNTIKEWAHTQNDIELLFVWPSSRSISFYQRAGFHTENQPLVLEI